MNPRLDNLLKGASRSRLLVVACVLGLVGLALTSWSLFDQGWIPIMMAMSIGQGVGTLSFLLFLWVVIVEVRNATFRASTPTDEPAKKDR